MLKASFGSSLGLQNTFITLRSHGGSIQQYALAPTTFPNSVDPVPYMGTVVKAILEQYVR